MNDMPPKRKAGRSVPMLEVADLQVHYGHAHVLQGISLVLERGVLGVIGRNGMGKTTLCQSIMGLKRPTSGSIRLMGQELVGLASNEIAKLGVGYVPQGRRTWPSLTVDEHLRLMAQKRVAKDGWTVERVYETFPRLAERRRNGGTQLSGGEQQMLAIGRALLLNPRLLVMDEPTEGLAPVIVDQVENLLKTLAQDGALAVLLVEQNLGVATATAERVAIVVNGRIARNLPAAELAADRALQERLLGVRAHGDDTPLPSAALEPDAPPAPEIAAEPARVLRVVRRARDGEPNEPGFSTARVPTRWSSGNPLADRVAALGPPVAAAEIEPPPLPMPKIGELAGHNVYVAGTYDTKARELLYMKGLLDRLGLKTVSVDLSTGRKPSPADVSPQEVARHHPKGLGGVFSDDRGAAVAAMAVAFERFVATRRDIGGMLSAGGSGGTSLATPGMRRLAVGVPKIMVSTVASGDVGRYVGPSDIMMMYSVTDVQGLNRISEQVLANAAHAMAGMVAHKRAALASSAKPALGMTMFGVTTPCVQELQVLMGDRYDCLVFHATGTGGQSMEKLADSGLLEGVIDVTTTEVCDLLMGGVFPATEDRFGAIARTRIPYVGSCGALDTVNFGARDTVPERYRQRTFHVHNPNVTLMRTTPEENARMGKWIAEKLNKCDGPVRFLVPEGGVSAIDVPGKPFHDPAADKALFDALQRHVRQSETRRLIRLPHAINDPVFAKALADTYLQLARAPVGASARAKN